jgi:hypothetical protein
VTTDYDRDVIYKLVLRNPGGEPFQVPIGSRLVSVGADPAGQGPAVWFRRYAPPPQGDPGSPTVTWTLGFRGTGHPFPADAIVLGTVLAGPFAFHVLDMDGRVTR